MQKDFFFSFSLDWSRNYGWEGIVLRPCELLWDDIMQREHGVQRKQQSVTLCVVLWKIFQTNGNGEFTGRTGSILQKWDAMKGGNSEPFICRVTEHNHLFPEIRLLTTQNEDRTRPIDFLPGHKLANHQTRRQCSASSWLVTPSTCFEIPSLTAVLLDLQADTTSLTWRNRSFLIKQSLLMYDRRVWRDAAAPLESPFLETNLNCIPTLAGAARTLLFWPLIVSASFSLYHFTPAANGVLIATTALI